MPEPENGWIRLVPVPTAARTDCAVATTETSPTDELKPVYTRTSRTPLKSTAPQRSKPSGVCDEVAVTLDVVVGLAVLVPVLVTVPEPEEEPVPVRLLEPVPVWLLVAVWLELAVPVAELLEVPVPVAELLAVPLALEVWLELAV